MRQLLRGRSDQLLTALVITLVLLGLAALLPAAAQRLTAKPAATPTPGPSRTAPPVAVLLPDETDRALKGVVIIANDHSYGTAFLINAQGDFLTASSLISNSESLRVIDNTVGMHEVRVMGIDNAAGVAMLRVAVSGGVPMSLGDASILRANDPVMVLASPKILDLQPATPAVITSVADSRLRVSVNSLPGRLGGPIVGPGAKVLGILTGSGTGIAIDQVQPDITQWIKQAGVQLPLSPMPPGLVLRGSDTTSSPPAPPPASSPTLRVTVQSVSPSHASAAQDTAVTIQGGGFVDGSALRVHFVPVSGAAGAFDGLGAAPLSSTTLTVKVPAGQLVQDYVIQLTNGDGAVVNSRVAFTVTS